MFHFLDPLGRLGNECHEWVNQVMKENRTEGNEEGRKEPNRTACTECRERRHAWMDERMSI